MSENNAITRREAIARTGLLLGGTLAASSLAGAENAAWAATPGWAPRTLSLQELELVATIAEHIIPTTDTPGARTAGVHRFVDVLLTDYYATAERNRFLAGLRGVNTRAMSGYGVPFLRASTQQQLQLVTALDAEAYPPKDARPAKAEPEGWFFRRMKELTLLGYYTSEVGATKELHVNPMGYYRGDLAYKSVGRAWA